MRFLSNEGLDICFENLDKPTVSSVIKKALDMDLREIGGNFLPEDLMKVKAEFITGPGVVQIQKIKNVSAPKYEYGIEAPPVLRLLLTDGNSYVNCLQWGSNPWKSITMDTPPGTKIYLKPVKIPMLNNFLLLSENQFTNLGGYVATLIEKWELNRQLASHIRTKENLDGIGPPPWIPFGKPIISNKPLKSAGNFKALELDTKEDKDDALFKQQRLANIAEISRVKETKVKSFGGKKERLHYQPDSTNRSYTQPNDHFRNQNEVKQYPNSFQDSPSRNKLYMNDKGKKTNQNDYSLSKQDCTRLQSFGFTSSPYGTSGKDNKAPNRISTLEDFITQDFRQHPGFQTKTFDGAHTSNSFSKTFKNASTRDYKHQSDKRIQENEPRNFVKIMEQMKIYGYDTKDKSNIVSTNILLKPGTEVMAKYWEDNKLYRAVVHAVGKEGKTCVVHFLDYGNYEEVLIDDVKEKNYFKDRNWNFGSISLHPNPRNNNKSSMSYYNQNSRDLSKSYKCSNRAYSRQDGNKPFRNDYKLSAKFYQSPN